MLRGAMTPLPVLEADAGTPHALMSQTRHSGVYESPSLTFSPYDETPSKPPALLPANSIERNASSTHRQHQRQQSIPSFSAKRSNVPSVPPRQGHDKRNFQDMPLTGDGRGGGNSPARLGGIRRSGPSTPSLESDAYGHFPQRSRTPVDTTPKSTTQSRLGFIASSVSAFTARMTSPTQVAPAKIDDELCDLNIEAALFPASPSSLLDSSSSSPGNGDAFSPAAYKNLQANATGLLHRMQDAYRQRTIALRELQAEHEAQREEIEEMELRTLNFKNQLEVMATKAVEQENAMQQLVAELQAERATRRRLQHEERVGKMALLSQRDVHDGEGDSERGLDERKHQRWSNGTAKSDVLSIDTDADSAESESIFSRSRSPTAMTCMTVDTESVVDVPTPNSLLHPRAAAANTTPKGKAMTAQQGQQPQQLTAFQRLVKGISREDNDGCRNCKGQDASVAWDTVSLLRDENIALKQRVAHLDVVIEGALDVVNGVGR
ncbi:hypothetical protein F5B22DRAFT_582821 [Xylaria bambusicola]|uniref:uncharacterized protein n=1 Tax=Xylaria bambusicola TaxID=326684 RepID=UPI00200852E7|nr:uncharacterized protein F5B22DRAFT_582821 [Xylaria bambusicola]KAI0527915.1 hypothetical protein F5B22DRAFT_582821 [Xylaria bambusicola]